MIKEEIQKMIRKITKMQYAVMCSILIGSSIFTSCGKMSAHNESTDTTTTFVSDGSSTRDASGMSTNTSYNAFLYNTHTDLSASVGIHDFGLGVSKQNNNADVTLEDVFYLINVFEGALSRHLWYDDSSLYSVFEDTMRYNVEIQNMLFEYIAQDSGMCYNQVVDEFESFAMIYYVNGVYNRNNSLTWLDEEEKNCIYDMFTNNIADFTVNIRNVIK